MYISETYIKIRHKGGKLRKREAYTCKRDLHNMIT